MELNSVKGNTSWNHFIQLANAAKVRNAGFTVPFQSTHNVDSENTNNTRNSVSRKLGGSIRSGYMDKIPQKSTNILGRNFDSYA